MSSIQEELARLTTARDNIKGVLDRLSVSYEGDKLDSLALAIGSIKKVEAKQENGVITIPAGYISEEQTFVVSSDLTTGYLINGADGNVYFQAVKEVDGEIVADGDPVKVEGIEIPDTGIDAPSPVYPLPEADIVTGYIINNDDGSVYFQRVKEVDGEIANDGDPVLISGANIPETGVDEPEYVCDSPATAGCEFYKCASVDTANKTWDGYKAVKVDGVYSFEETLTTGLSYDIITPLIDSIYNSDASAKIASLLTLFPETGLTFSNALSSADGWRFAGAEIVQDDTRPVFQTSGGSTYAVWEENPGVPLQSSPRTMSFWYKRTAYNGGWCGIGYGTSGGNRRFTASFRDNYPGVTLWADDYFQSSVGLIPENTWHHYVYTYDGNDIVTLYVDTEKAWEWRTGTTGTSWQYIHVGDPWESYANIGRFADLNIYDRVLESYEIAQLYNYRTV
jgi:hypothetical protein